MFSKPSETFLRNWVFPGSDSRHLGRGSHFSVFSYGFLVRYGKNFSSRRIAIIGENKLSFNSANSFLRQIRVQRTNSIILYDNKYQNTVKFARYGSFLCKICTAFVETPCI